MLNGKPVICITSDTNALSFEKDGKSRQIQAVVTYGEAIFNAGGIPIIAYEQCPEELAELCDGLLLSGGADVDPDLYGEEPFNDTVKCDPLRTAFEVLHKDEIIPAAMQYTAQQTKSKIAKSIAAGSTRPAENGISSQSAARVKSDVTQLSKADRDEIYRRAARGEKISFG